MSWIESIRVSFGTGNQGLGALGGMESLKKHLAPVPALSWECFRNLAVPEDLVLILKWEGSPPAAMESPVAANLVRELNRYGLASHTAWVGESLKEKRP